MSSKDEKKRIREEKKQAAMRRAKRNSLLVKIAIGVFIPLAVLVLLQGLMGRAPIYPPDEVAASDHVRGNPDAALTVTVYADFQCPACFTETQVIASAWPRIRDRVRLVFRHYPLDIHRHAFLAARYAEAAGRQDRFWEMHDILYSRQQLWSGLPDVTQTFDSYALELSLDMDQLKQDINDPEIRDKIVADQQGGTRAGVRGTPSMFFNGRQVANPRTATALVTMVNEHLTQ